MQVPTFGSEDEEAQFFLSVLRDGTDREKVVARERLATIFGRRGLLQEVVELLERNIQAGAGSPDLYARLSQTYRRLGQPDRADAALAEARRLQTAQTARPAPVSAARSAPTSGARPAPTAAARPASQPAPPAAPRPAGPAAPSADGRVIPFPAPAHPSTGDGRAGPAASSGSGAALALAPERWPDASVGPAPRPAPASAPAPASEPSPVPGQPEPRAARPSGLLVVLAIVVFMIVLPVMGLALLVVNPIALLLEGRAAGPTVDAYATAPARLKIAPGAASSWYLQAGRSVTGLWATPGLTLSLDQDLPGAGRSFPVTPARAQGWGETITIVERRGQGRATQDTILPARFEAPPDLPPAGTVLTGRVTGQVTAPRITDGSQYNTVSETLDTPVELIVVSAPEHWLDRAGSSLRLFFVEDRWVLVTIGALLGWCAVAGIAAVVMQVRRVRGRSRG